MPIIPRTRSVSSPVSFCGIATSRVSRSRNGETMLRLAETAIRRRTRLSRARYGLKSAAMRRRSGGGLSCGAISIDEG